MDNKEINEYIAVNLFGYEKRVNPAGIVYFMKPTPTEQYPHSKTNVGKYDYITNYQPVLEKLDLYGKELTIGITDNHIYYCLLKSYKDIYFDECYEGREFTTEAIGNGDTLGESICNAAVEYHKAKGGN